MFGHSPEHYCELSTNIFSTIGRTMDILNYQYGQDLVFNLIGEPGAGICSIKNCLMKGLKYHLYVPCLKDKVLQASYLTEEQKQDLAHGFDNAYNLTISGPTKNDYYIQNQQCFTEAIDHANFSICFWVGKKQGMTYDCIKYAHKNNKLILNGLDDLKLITNQDTER